MNAIGRSNKAFLKSYQDLDDDELIAAIEITEEKFLNILAYDVLIKRLTKILDTYKVIIAYVKPQLPKLKWFWRWEIRPARYYRGTIPSEIRKLIQDGDYIMYGAKDPYLIRKVSDEYVIVAQWD